MSLLLPQLGPEDLTLTKSLLRTPIIVRLLQWDSKCLRSDEPRFQTACIGCLKRSPSHREGHFAAGTLGAPAKAKAASSGTGALALSASRTSTSIGRALHVLDSRIPACRGREHVSRLLGRQSSLLQGPLAMSPTRRKRGVSSWFIVLPCGVTRCLACRAPGLL